MFGYVVSIAVPPHFREPVQGYKQTVLFLLFWLNLCQRAEEMQNKNNEKRNHICLAPFKKHRVTLHTLSDISVLVFLCHDNYVRVALSKNLANDHIFILLYEKNKENTWNSYNSFQNRILYKQREKHVFFSPHCKATIAQLHDRSVALLILI